MTALNPIFSVRITNIKKCSKINTGFIWRLMNSRDSRGCNIVEVHQIRDPGILETPDFTTFQSHCVPGWSHKMPSNRAYNNSLLQYNVVSGAAELKLNFELMCKNVYENRSWLLNWLCTCHKVNLEQYGAWTSQNDRENKEMYLALYICLDIDKVSSNNVEDTWNKQYLNLCFCNLHMYIFVFLGLGFTDNRVLLPN